MMNGHDFDQWTPQAPPADFAERCVGAMLDEPAPESHRRWVGRGGTFFFLAAALVASSAWATGQARASSPPIEAVRFVGSMPLPVVVEAPPPPSLQPVDVERDDETEDEAPDPPSRYFQPAKPATPPQAAEVPAEQKQPQPPPFVMQPRCACDQGAVVCSCF